MTAPDAMNRAGSGGVFNLREKFRCRFAAHGGMYESTIQFRTVGHTEGIRWDTFIIPHNSVEYGFAKRKPIDIRAAVEGKWRNRATSMGPVAHR